MSSSGKRAQPADMEEDEDTEELLQELELEQTSPEADFENERPRKRVLKSSPRTITTILPVGFGGKCKYIDGTYHKCVVEDFEDGMYTIQWCDGEQFDTRHPLSDFVGYETFLGPLVASGASASEWEGMENVWESDSDEFSTLE